MNWQYQKNKAKHNETYAYSMGYTGKVSPIYAVVGQSDDKRLSGHFEAETN